MTQKGKITKATGVVSGATLISRILGLVRDIVIAQLFGARGATDAFFVSFAVPNMLRRLFAEGGLSSSFVPVYSEYANKEGPEAARRLADSVFTMLSAMLAVVSIAGVVLAPWFIRILVPGFAATPGKIELTVLLTRAVFPFIFFMGLAALSTGILNTRGHFFWPAVSPAFLNAAMIVCAIVLRAKFGVPILTLAVGALLGGLIQFLVQVPPMLSRGVAPRVTLDFARPGLGKVLRLMVPALFGLGVMQVNVVVDRWIASWLPEGSVSYLYYANRLVQFPLGVFGIAIAVAILPVLSEHAAKEELNELKSSLCFGVKLAMFIMVPASVGLMVLKMPLINVFFQRGAFAQEATISTAAALFYYSMGLFAFAGVPLAASVFYSLQDTKTPFKIAIYAVLINLILNLMLMGPMRHKGLALATSISSMVNFFTLLLVMYKRIGSYGGWEILRSTLKCLLASGLMGLVIWSLYRQLFSLASPTLVRVGLLVLCILVGTTIYFVINRLWESEELSQLLSLVRRA